jgi:hypothetical protein
MSNIDNACSSQIQLRNEDPLAGIAACTVCTGTGFVINVNFKSKCSLMSNFKNAKGTGVDQCAQAWISVHKRGSVFIGTSGFKFRDQHASPEVLKGELPKWEIAKALYE